jgi:hypothetical protein
VPLQQGCKGLSPLMRLENESHPVRTLPVADRPGRSERQTSLPAMTNGPNEQDPSEGWQNGNAPVSKTGVLTDFRVRIPAPPLHPTP